MLCFRASSVALPQGRAGIDRNISKPNSQRVDKSSSAMRYCAMVDLLLGSRQFFVPYTLP
jgi:hypothetical protein